MEVVYGMLDVKVMRAELTRSTNTFSKMNPYVTIEHSNRGTVLTTGACKKGNKKPNWNHIDSIVVDEVIGADMTFKLSVYSK